MKEEKFLLREQELVRQQQKDEMDERCKESIAGLTKNYGYALKHALPRMGHDMSDYPAYFLAVENLFSLYEIPKKAERRKPVVEIPKISIPSEAFYTEQEMYFRENIQNYAEWAGHSLSMSRCVFRMMNCVKVKHKT